MEFLLIGDSKLKIVLDDDEVKSHRLDSAHTDSCDAGFRRSFWKILEKAKQSVGFDPCGDKILIQFYPVQNGGCEVFVTKLGLLSDASARLVARSDKVTMLSKKCGFYAFLSFCDLVSVCKSIYAKVGDDAPKGDAYYDGKRFYLLIDEYGKGGETMEFPFMIEYGNELPADLALRVKEHGDLLIKEDAVRRLSEL